MAEISPLRRRMIDDMMIRNRCVRLPVAGLRLSELLSKGSLGPQ